MASRSTNTMQEWIQGIMRDIADAKGLSDADVPWLIQLENMVMARMKQPVDALVQSGQRPGVPAGPTPGLPAGQGVGGGFMAGPQAPNPDELSRLLGAGASGLGV